MNKPKKPLFSSLKILVVEDYNINLEIIVDMLEFFGIKADTSNNGKEAIEKASTNDYDLILMDIRMPEMDGYEASLAIRRLPLKRQPLIIALTASSALREKAQFRDFGIDDFILKPIEIDEIEKMLVNYFPDRLSQD